MRVRDIEVKKRIGESSKFRIYLGERGDQHEEVVLKVAKTFEDGDILSKEAGIFTSLGAFADEIARLEEGSGAGNTANYGQLLAHLESSFMEPTQGDRMINVFSFPDTTMSELTPMAKLYKSTEIDPRTSVWILGRLFKLYGFYELIKEDGIPSYPHFRADDYLIGPAKHRLIYYNCSEMTADVECNYFVGLWQLGAQINWAELGIGSNNYNGSGPLTSITGNPITGSTGPRTRVPQSMYGISEDPNLDM